MRNTFDLWYPMRSTFDLWNFLVKIDCERWTFNLSFRSYRTFYLAFVSCRTYDLTFVSRRTFDRTFVSRFVVRQCFDFFFEKRRPSRGATSKATGHLSRSRSGLVQGQGRVKVEARFLGKTDPSAAKDTDSVKVTVGVMSRPRSVDLSGLFEDGFRPAQDGTVENVDSLRSRSSLYRGRPRK